MTGFHNKPRAERPLSERCRRFLRSRADDRRSEKEIANDLEVFIQAEIGRAAGGPALDDAQALVLFFHNEKDREELMRVLLAANPNLKARKAP